VTLLAHVYTKTNSIVARMMPDVTMIIDDATMSIFVMTGVIVDVMSGAVTGIHPYAYL
jgi:hypothetical protein